MSEYTLPKSDDVEFLADVDGVFANFIQRALDVVERLSGTRYRVEDMKTWDMFDMIPRTYEDACYVCFKEPGFCSSIEPYPGAKQVVKALDAATHLYFVTSPLNGPNWVHERTEWLKEHFGTPSKRVINASAKWQVAGDILLDDRPANLYPWLDRHPRGIALLWDQPYNQTATPHPRMIRASSWEQVFAIIEKVKFTKRMFAQ